MRKIYFLMIVFAFGFSSRAQVTIFSENVGTPGATTLINSYTGWQNVSPITFSSTGTQSDVRTSSPSSSYSGASGNGNVFMGGIISGIIISFSKEINIDDYVKIGTHQGKITEINLTKVSLLNDDDDIIYIPNDKVYMSEIINYTKREIKKVSIDFELSIKYHTTIEQLEKTISESLKDFQHFIEPDSFTIKIVDVHHEYLSLKCQYKLQEVNREVERMIRKKTIRLIANSIKEE